MFRLVGIIVMIVIIIIIIMATGNQFKLLEVV